MKGFADLTNPCPLLTRFAEEHGASIGPAANVQQLDSVARAFVAPGHCARVVELDSATLACLALPALCIVQGRMCVVRGLKRSRVLLENDQGQLVEVSRVDLLSQTAGEALEVVPALRRVGTFHARLFDLLGRKTGELGKLIVTSLCIIALGLVAPLLTGAVVDRALPERAPKLLAVAALSVLLVAGQRALFSWLEKRAFLGLSAQLQSTMMSGLVDHLLRIPYAELAREHVGAWLETLGGAQKAQSAYLEGLLPPLLHTAMAVVYGGALLHASLALGGVVVLGASLLFALSVAFATRTQTLKRSVIEASADQRATLFENIEGVTTLRTCGADERGTLRWLDRMLASRAAAVRLDRLASLERALVGGLREALVMGVFLWAAYLCLSGEQSVGGIIALQMMAERYVSTVGELGAALSPVLSAQAQVKRVDALLAHEEVAPRGKVGAAAELSQGDAVVLEDVWFRYGPDQPWVLQGYNLRIASLAHHELRGPSGMGKSTILRIIAGLYTPERGNVLVYGRSPSELRGQICYLPQDSQLFQGSILQNLRLLSGASDAELVLAAERSGLDALVRGLPMGYETVIAAGAATLSGGQRQLIMWTAAMASKRTLLLLDEALSHVDPLARGGLLAMANARAHTVVAVEHERRPATALAVPGPRAGELTQVTAQ
ncbi:MAG: hypothetical protein RL385_1870 [Pseudomonadota bacterium]|jgi:ABC-type bacteriocin/lantibiotic exporter with double-glycine peptidase domain